MRREIELLRKDLTTAGKAWKDSTEKFVTDISPKVSTTLDETMDRTSEALKRTMATIDKQTQPQQVKLLRAYKTLLSKQVDLIEKRLKRMIG